jgi:acyl-coenzyme A synthetase/AMP-(fatty) acid ligase
MKMPRNNSTSLWASLITADRLSSRLFVGVEESASWGELVERKNLTKRIGDLRGRSVLIATIDQFKAAALLIQLDGIARRIVLYPPDMSREHLFFVADSAATDVILTDQPTLASVDPRVECIALRDSETDVGFVDRSSPIETEWILLTSGTTGLPKLVLHTLTSLTGAIKCGGPVSGSITWSTFYDIRRYGGLQIFLRAVLTGTSLVLQGEQEPTSDFLARAGAQGVTHISGTPSHWRRALMNPWANRIAPEYVRLSGEIADQAVLNQLRTQYPQAKIGHAFASTEAGVAFDVNDGLAGVPSDTIGHTSHVEMKVEGCTLRVRSSRSASCYLGEGSQPLKDNEGFVDTGDVLELRNGRYYFVGRRDGTINVGGLKVHPEEVEVVINRHPEVRMSLVSAKKNPIIGTLVVADVVLKTSPRVDDNGTQSLQRDILQFCRAELAVHKVPIIINFVSNLAVAETGKLIRHHA